jgi:hypothetical protein
MSRSDAMSLRQLYAGSALGLLVSVALLGYSPALFAQDESPGRKFFKEGRALAAEGKYAEACPKFEASLRLEVGVGTQFNLADCWEHVGRAASAQKLFLGAAASAKAAGQPEREQVLRDRAAALEPRISKLVIEVSDETPKLSVKRDQLPMSPEDFGKAIAVDPGSYEIVAKAPGKKPWKKTVEVAAGTPVVTVEVPALEADEPDAAPASKAAADKAEAAHAAPAAPIAPPPSKLNYRALGLGAFGVVSLATGTFFGFRYKSSNDDAKAICPENKGCTLSQITKHDQLVDRATTARSWMYLGVGVGTFAVGGAIALYALGGSTQPAQASIRAFPSVGEHGELGANVVGAF